MCHLIVTFANTLTKIGATSSWNGSRVQILEWWLTSWRLCGEAERQYRTDLPDAPRPSRGPENTDNSVVTEQEDECQKNGLWHRIDEAKFGREEARMRSRSSGTRWRAWGKRCWCGGAVESSIDMLEDRCDLINELWVSKLRMGVSQYIACR